MRAFFGAPDRVLIGTSFVMIGVAHDLSRPELDVEVWTGPPRSRGDWEINREGDVCAALTTLTLGGMEPSSNDIPVLLDEPGRYGVRVSGSGRAEAQRLWTAEFVDGVERWRIQLWPKRSTQP